MKLLLTSGGISNRSIANALNELVGRNPSEVKVDGGKMDIITEGAWKLFNG